MERDTARRSLEFDQPPDSVFAFVDESYEPFVAAVAVAVESSDVCRIDSGVTSLHDEICTWFHMRGMPSFEEFRQRGFHATSDPYEIRTAFVKFLHQAACFKSMIVYSDRTTRRDLSDKRRLMIVFDQLVRDTLRTYRSRTKVIFVFESAGAMDKYIERLVERAGRSLRHRTPDIEIRFGRKREPYLLAVPDYVLHIFNQWLQGQHSNQPSLDPMEHQSRSFLAILGSMSAARSIDHSRTVRRTLDGPSV